MPLDGPRLVVATSCNPVTLFPCDGTCQCHGTTASLYTWDSQPFAAKTLDWWMEMGRAPTGSAYISTSTPTPNASRTNHYTRVHASKKKHWGSSYRYSDTETPVRCCPPTPVYDEYWFVSTNQNCGGRPHPKTLLGRVLCHHGCRRCRSASKKTIVLTFHCRRNCPTFGWIWLSLCARGKVGGSRCAAAAATTSPPPTAT